MTNDEYYDPLREGAGPIAGREGGVMSWPHDSDHMHHDRADDGRILRSYSCSDPSCAQPFQRGRVDRDAALERLGTAIEESLRALRSAGANRIRNELESAFAALTKGKAP